MASTVITGMTSSLIKEMIAATVAARLLLSAVLGIKQWLSITCFRSPHREKLNEIQQGNMLFTMSSRLSLPVSLSPVFSCRIAPASARDALKFRRNYVDDTERFPPLGKCPRPICHRSPLP